MAQNQARNQTHTNHPANERSEPRQGGTTASGKQDTQQKMQAKTNNPQQQKYEETLEKGTQNPRSDNRQ